MDPIDDLLTRGITNIIPHKSTLEGLLKSGQKFNVYLGIDPTSVHIHLGHATHLRRLQKLVNLGHYVTFLIGDFTALIGDTSDKDRERPVLTPSEIEANWQTYKSQAEKVIDFSRVAIRRNSEWLKDLTFEDIIKLTRHFSLNDFISRELIKKRLETGGSVSLPEVLYPVMQGYDSYFMDTDIQLGGPDQTFNMQAGRTLQHHLRDKESFVLVGQFLTGTDGRKMSKSWNNAVWLDDSPNDIYGKIMSLGDSLIDEYFLLATNLPESEFPESNISPMSAKKQLAFQIVKDLYGEPEANKAKSYFESTFQQGQTPPDLPEISVKSTNIIDVLVESGLAQSKGAARRLIDQAGVQFNDEKISDFRFQISNSGTLRVGRKFVKIKI